MVTKYIVVNNHTIGYLESEFPNRFGIVHASVRRGSPYTTCNWSALLEGVTFRTATAEDFEAYSVTLPPNFFQVNPVSVPSDNN